MRADLVPVLVALIQEHRGPAARDALAHTLFNLVKRPSAAQRRMVLGAWRDLAAAIGPARTAEELLPQCWEQVRGTVRPLGPSMHDLPVPLTHRPIAERWPIAYGGTHTLHLW